MLLIRTRQETHKALSRIRSRFCVLLPSFSRLVISIIAILSTFGDMAACDEARKFWFDG
jgi:hypothetical protein